MRTTLFWRFAITGSARTSCTRCYMTCATIFFAEEEGGETLWPEFRTYYSFWLSALYVVAEGFQELKLRSPTIQKKIAAHIDELRVFRNGTFHFQRSHTKQLRMLDGQAARLNW